MDELQGASLLEQTPGALDRLDLSSNNKLADIITENQKSLAGILKGIFTRLRVRSCSSDRLCLGHFPSSDSRNEIVSALKLAVNTIASEVQTAEGTSAVLSNLSSLFGKMEDENEPQDVDIGGASAFTPGRPLIDTSVEFTGIGDTSLSPVAFLTPRMDPLTSDADIFQNGNAGPIDLCLGNKLDVWNCKQGHETWKLRNQPSITQHHCQYCNKFDDCTTRLLDHSKFCSKNMKNFSLLYKAKKRCPICRMVFYSQSELLQHSLEHRNPRRERRDPDSVYENRMTRRQHHQSCRRLPTKNSNMHTTSSKLHTSKPKSGKNGKLNTVALALCKSAKVSEIIVLD